MTDNISDRQIERLALGELDEAEANDLMRRLEERGELERFEAIIADDEAFLEAHPPALLATQVRAEVRRRTREHMAKEPKMLSPSRTPVAIGVAFAAAAILFAILYVRALTPTPLTPEQVAATTNDGQTNTAAPTPAPIPSEQPEAQPAPVALLERDVQVPLPPTFYLPKGSIVQAVAVGLNRVSLSETSVIKATVHDDLMYLEAKDAGQSMLMLGREIDGEQVSRSSLFIVGEPLADETMQTLVPSLADCAAHGEGILSIRVVAQTGTAFVGNAHVGGEPLSSALRACIDTAVSNWKVKDHVEPVIQDGNEFPGPAALSVGVLRYNLSAGAVCIPGEDGC